MVMKPFKQKAAFMTYIAIIVDLLEILTQNLEEHDVKNVRYKRL